MNDLFIQGLTIDWNRVRPYNYVRQIPAISGIDTFTFHKPITCLLYTSPSPRDRG